MGQGAPKKKKYKIQKQKKFNYKRMFMTIFALSVLVVMIVVFSVIDSIPGGVAFKLSIQKTPGATLFIFFFSLVINLCSTLLGKALIDTHELQRRTQLIKDHNKEKKDAEKFKDTNPRQYQKKMIKIKRREQSIKKMTQSISMQRMKPSCVTFLPMIILFFFIRTLFNVNGFIFVPPGGDFWFDVMPGGAVGVARTVMNPYPELSFLGAYLYPNAFWGYKGFIGFTAYYFLCSFSLNTVVQRLAGLNTGGMGGMGGLPGFGGQGLK